MPVRNDFAPGEFCWVDLSAHDLHAAVEWYGKLFDWSHMMMETPAGGPPYAFFMQGQAGIGGIGEMSPEMKAQGIPPMWNSYVCSADCEATEAKVEATGGKVVVPPTDIPVGRFALFGDPQGAMFSVITLAQAPS